MSFVTAAMSYFSRSARQRARVSAVLPEPTGPPMPTRSGPSFAGGSFTRALCPVPLAVMRAHQPDKQAGKPAERGAADHGEAHAALARLQHVVENERDERKEKRAEDCTIKGRLADGLERALRLLHECIGH